ncbi:MAG: hypothetical protein VYA34_03435 [Myxococcota bacterium]|nr:hypothetical protein [Myxococcota bacterium]
MSFEIKNPITTVDGLKQVFDQCDSADEAIEAIEQATAESKMEFNLEMAEFMQATIAKSRTSVDHGTIDAVILSLEPQAPKHHAPHPVQLPTEASIGTMRDVALLRRPAPRPPEVSTVIAEAMEIRATDRSTGTFGKRIAELELLFTHPENFIFGLAINHGHEQCDKVYQTMMASGTHTPSCGDVSSFLFRTLADADSATLTKYTSEDDTNGGSIKIIKDELSKDGDQILRVTLGSHSFLIEKRGSFDEGTCRVFQSSDSGGGPGGYSFATAFRRDGPMDTPNFLQYLEAILHSPYPNGDARWAEFHDGAEAIFRGTVDPLRLPSNTYGLSKCIEVEVPPRLNSLDESLAAFTDLAQERAKEFHQFRTNDLGLDVRTYHQSKWPKSWGGH